VIVVAAMVVDRQQPASATAPGGPSVGYTLHIDADQHFGSGHPDQIAHHWCKTISPTLTECQLFDSDGPGARLVGVETIVPASVWQKFSPSEQALWHYHKTELKKIHATLPDTPKDKQAAIIAAIAPTYGKVFILWNPMVNPHPAGQPSITVLK
jgi:hypothetical protein